MEQRDIARAQAAAFAAEASESGPKTSFDRSILKSKDDLRFRYGELVEGHPTLEYVRQLARRIPLKEGYDLNIYICPDWPVVNAVAYPDGSVFISGELLKQADTEEALLAVINHEYIHISRQHIQKKNQLKVDSFSSLLRSISLGRVQEYEADLRGVLAELEEAGINPLGYKAFLEKLVSQEAEMGGSDLVHGSVKDRTLNIATAIHLVDLKSLTFGLNPVQTEALNQLDNTKQRISRRLLISSPSSYWDPEKAAAFKEKQSEAIERIGSVKEALMALGIAVEPVIDWIYSRHKVEEDSNLNERIDRLYKKVVDLSPDTLSDEDRERLALMHLAVFTKVPVWKDLKPRKKGWVPPAVKQIRSQADKLLGTTDGLEAARQLAQQYTLNTGFEYSEVSATDFALEMASFAYKKGIVQAAPEKFIQNWVDYLGETSHKLDRTSPVSTEGIEDLLRKRLEVLAKAESPNQEEDDMEIQDQDVEELAQEFEEELVKPRGERRKEFIDPKELGFYDLGYDFGQIGRFEKSKAISEKSAKFLEMAEGMSLKELSNLLILLEEGAQSKFNELEIDLRSADWERDFTSLLIVKLVFEALGKLPQFSKMPQMEKDLVMIAVASRLDVNDPEVQRMEEYQDNVEEANERRKIRKLGSDEKLYTRDNYKSEEAVILAFQYLADKEFYTENVNIEAFFGSDVSESEKIFLNYFIQNLNGQSLTEILETLNRYSDRGVDIVSLMEKHPEVSGILMPQIADGIEDGSFRSLNLEQLLIVSRWITNPFLQSAFQRMAKDLYWKELSFEEKLHTLHSDKGISDPETKEDFIELDVRTPEQFEQVLEKVKLSIDELATEGSAKAGVATVLSHFNFQFRDVTAFAKAILESKINERSLRLLIYEGLRQEEAGWDNDDSEEPDIRNTYSRLLLADQVLRGLYSLDQFGKHALLRQIFTAEYGILPNKPKREKFLNFLFDEWVDKGSRYEDLNDVLRKAKEGLTGIEDWELLYFALSSALVDKIAQPPDRKHRLAWSDFYEVESDLEGAGASPSTVKRILRDTKLARIPKYAQRNPRQHSNYFIVAGETRLYDALEKEDVLKFNVEPRLNPLQFIKQTVSKTGAPGVRFLQLAPQFIDVSPDYESEFSEVYDGLKGQSKLAAYILLKREWPKIWEEIDEIQERVGGGSIVTVYKTKTKEGGTEVLKVRNPNIQYHLNETYKFASTVLDYLGNKYGGGYSAARIALDDIKRWIEGDITFEGFLEQDKQFRAAHQNYQPDGHRYSIMVPETRGPENAYFVREEYVEGKNLTKWNDLAAEGHDMKQAVSVMVKNYVRQIQEGLVHSDVHPGNFRVTAENRVAVLDRNFYLSLTDIEKELIFSLVNPLVSVEARTKLLWDYVNSEKIIEPEVHPALTQLATDMASQNWTQVHSGIVKIKQMGVVIPLNLTLLLKNLNSLEMMSKKAGFASIGEAFFYSPQT